MLPSTALKVTFHPLLPQGTNILAGSVCLWRGSAQPGKAQADGAYPQLETS